MTMREENPCHHCTERTATCHADCERYHIWSAKHERERDERYEKRQQERAMDAMEKARIARFRRAVSRCKKLNRGGSK